MPKNIKIQTIDSLRFGIEIEVEFPHPEESQKLIEKHRVIKGWDIDYDGSLDNGAEYRPLNKNKLFFDEDSLDQIKEILGLIGAHKGYANKDCGLHVHIDMSNFNNKQIVNIVKAFVNNQNKIIKKFRPYKSRLDFACQEIPKEVVSEINEKVIANIKNDNYNYNDKILDYFMSRQYVLNIQSLVRHNTLEFRIFNSSLKIKEITEAIKWCLEFCITNS